MENLITQAVEIDIKATKKKSDPLLGETLCKLQAAIQACGVSSIFGKKRMTVPSLIGHH